MPGELPHLLLDVHAGKDSVSCLGYNELFIRWNLNLEHSCLSHDCAFGNIVDGILNFKLLPYTGSGICP